MFFVRSQEAPSQQQPPQNARRGSLTGVLAAALFFLVSLNASTKILDVFARDVFAQRRRQAIRTRSATSGALRAVKAGRRNARGRRSVVDVPNALVRRDYLRHDPLGSCCSIFLSVLAPSMFAAARSTNPPSSGGK